MTGLIRPLLLMLALLLFGNARGWAETYSLTPDSKSTGSSYTTYITSLTEFTYEEVSWMMNQWNPSTLQVKTNQANAANEFRFYNTSAFAGKITKVVVTFSAFSVSDASKLMFLGGTSAVTATTGGSAGTWNATAKTLTWTPGENDNFTYFAFYQNGKAASGTNYLAEADAIVVTYETSGSQPSTLEESDLALTGAPVALSFDLYNNSDDQVISYTTSSTGAVTISGGTGYVTTSVDATNKTITVTPTAVTPSAQTITISQEADETYAAGSATFTVSVDDSTPTPTHTATFSVNGQTTTQDFEEGAAITFPANPDDVEGKTFWGWTSEAINGTTDEAPTKVTSATMGESDVTYYAVFATKTEDESGSYTLDYDNESELSSSTNWGSYGTSYRYTASDGGIWTIKAYKSSGMQINAGRNSSIKVPNCAGYIQSIEIKGSASKAVGFSAEDYFGSSTLNTFLAEGTDATSQTLDLSAASVTGGYIVPKSGNISITMIVVNYLASSYSNYCTTVAADTREEAGIAFTGTTNEYTANLYGEFEEPVLENSHQLQITYSSSNTDVATVDASTGAVTLVGVGVTTISAAFEGNDDYKPATVSYTLTVADNRQVADLAFTGTTSEYTANLGEAFSNPELSAPQGVTITYSSSNTAVATVDASTGAVTLVAAGETTITATSEANNNYKAGTASYTLTVESHEPSIVFDGEQNPDTETYTAGSTNIHYEASNLTEQVTIVLCDAEGNAATYDWFSAELYGESYVAVSWQANEDAENTRTAYFYLQSGNTRSEIFALTQEQFVADYATLPFEFVGGKADIGNTNGLSQTGLGSDYGSSPYLKFDGTGDNLILKLNEVPGTLTFDIKGNSFSGGTFKVQTSADGETYTDLESYTTFANSTQSEEFDNLSDNVRYIKWIYTEKNEGNVALGNIKVDKYVAPSTEPTITLSATSIEAIFAEADGTITVTCENMGDAPELDIIFCDAQGTEATYNWIDAEINDENNVYYTISANEGEARTAYMKVYGLDTEANDVYSELITITQEAYVEATSYALATDINAIGSGKHYIIVGNFNNDYFAMGAQNTNNRAAVSVTANNGTISVSSQDVKEVVIVGPDKDSHYAIYDGTGYLYAVSSSDNYLKTKEELDANGLWSISFDDGTHAATITASGDKARNNLRFNTQSTLFSCYKSGQADVYLYEKVNDTPEATDVVNITSAGYATYCSEHALDFSNATGIKAYVGTLNGTELTFTPITKVPARTGVLLQSTGGTEVGATIIPITTTPSEVTNNCLTGVTAETNLSSEDYILNVKEAGAGFYKAGNYTTLGANRAYIAAQQGGQVKGFVINLNGDLPTGVAQMDGEKLNADDAAIFNLNGQRISKPQKGVNIVNGKKVLVK